MVAVGLQPERGLEVGLEPEQFSRFRLTAATLSRLSTPSELPENTASLSDTMQLVNENAIIKGVKVVVESLAVRQPVKLKYILYCSLISKNLLNKRKLNQDGEATQKKFGGDTRYSIMFASRLQTEREKRC